MSKSNNPSELEIIIRQNGNQAASSMADFVNEQGGGGGGSQDFEGDVTITDGDLHIEGGGLNVSGSINAGFNISAPDGSISTGGNLSCDGGLTVQRETQLNDKLGVNGKVSANDGLSVSGETKLNGNVSFANEVAGGDFTPSSIRIPDNGAVIRDTVTYTLYRLTVANGQIALTPVE